MSGRILFVFEFKDPLDIGMGIFHGTQPRVYVQHEEMRVGLVVCPNELDALYPIVADCSACDPEVMGLPRDLDDIREKCRGICSRAILKGCGHAILLLPGDLPASGMCYNGRLSGAVS